jgi:hypothetical protein
LVRAPQAGGHWSDCPRTCPSHHPPAQSLRSQYLSLVSIQKHQSRNVTHLTTPKTPPLHIESTCCCLSPLCKQPRSVSPKYRNLYHINPQPSIPAPLKIMLTPHHTCRRRVRARPTRIARRSIRSPCRQSALSEPHDSSKPHPIQPLCPSSSPPPHRSTTNTIPLHTQCTTARSTLLLLPYTPISHHTTPHSSSRHHAPDDVRYVPASHRLHVLEFAAPAHHADETSSFRIASTAHI